MSSTNFYYFVALAIMPILLHAMNTNSKRPKFCLVIHAHQHDPQSNFHALPKELVVDILNRTHYLILHNQAKEWIEKANKKRANKRAEARVRWSRMESPQ